MIKRPLMLLLSASLLAGCSHQPTKPGVSTLTVDSFGSRLYGPTPVMAETTSIKTNRACPNLPGTEQSVHISLGTLIGGIFSYSCYSSCFVGVGEGDIGNLPPGGSITLDCHDPSLQVVLHEG